MWICLELFILKIWFIIVIKIAYLFFSFQQCLRSWYISIKLCYEYNDFFKMYCLKYVHIFKKTHQGRVLRFSRENCCFFSYIFTMVVFVEKQIFPEPSKDLIGFVQSVEQFLVVAVFYLTGSVANWHQTRSMIRDWYFLNA